MVSLQRGQASRQSITCSERIWHTQIAGNGSSLDAETIRDAAPTGVRQRPEIDPVGVKTTSFTSMTASYSRLPYPASGAVRTATSWCRPDGAGVGERGAIVPLHLALLEKATHNYRRYGITTRFPLGRSPRKGHRRLLRPAWRGRVLHLRTMARVYLRHKFRILVGNHHAHKHPDPSSSARSTVTDLDDVSRLRRVASARCQAGQDGRAPA